MIKIKRNKTIIFIISILTTCAFATSTWSLSPNTYLSEVEKNLPKIMMLEEKLNVARGKTQKALGAFDSSLKVKRKQYIDSYYTTQFTDASISRTFETMGAKAQIGFQKGTGRIPVYDAEMQTDEVGEFYASLSVNLLRYRSIDKNRFKLWEARNKERIAELTRAFKMVDTMVSANNAYWKWYFYYYKREMYELLVKLNKDRLKAIRKRVKRNDLARIYLVEANQYLLKFQRELANVTANLEAAVSKMQVYNPKVTITSKPITEMDKKLPRVADYPISKIVKNRPELRIYKLLIANGDLSLQMAKQKLQPKLNLEATRYEARDKAIPNVDENILALNFEVPIERDLGRGDVAAAKSKINALRLEQQMVERELKASLLSLDARINGDNNAFNILMDELTAAKKLQRAEWRKFQTGASDFFLVNVRDVNFAKTKINALERFADFNMSSYVMGQWQKITQ